MNNKCAQIQCKTASKHVRLASNYSLNFMMHRHWRAHTHMFQMRSAKQNVYAKNGKKKAMHSMCLCMSVHCVARDSIWMCCITSSMFAFFAFFFPPILNLELILYLRPDFGTGVLFKCSSFCVLKRKNAFYSENAQCCCYSFLSSLVASSVVCFSATTNQSRFSADWLKRLAICCVQCICG